APAPAAPAAPGGSVAWRAEGRNAAGRQLLYRGNFNGVEVAWIDPQLTRPVFSPGTDDPGGPFSWGGQIDPGVRPRLVAAFNGGFQLKDTPGGFYHEGRTVKGLVPGQGTLVIYNDGRATVGQWGRDVDLTPDVVSARQNLGLLVDGGVPVPAAANPGSWGGSVAGIATARSGVGVDANGALVLAQARVTPQGLAEALVAAGAVRAMQLDINPDWTSMVIFNPNPDGSPSGYRSMGSGGPGGLYLSPYGRDFFAVILEPHVVAGGNATIGAPPVNAAAKIKVAK
ncbi:MAG: phosphodiester glycosidase family protein, partial [Actinobacteria bacterium]|nr:phosphodiester glycosidase family protein [Actinomycetota bacterium]